MRKNIMHRGIAMIELIFAIVVMGIVMMSAPMLISTASESGYAAIQQEGINEAASQINIILGYAWDDENTEVDRPVVILGTDGDSDLDKNTTTERRAGTPLVSFRTFVDDDGDSHSASTVFADGDLDDMDDFDGRSISLNVYQSADTGDKATTADYVEKERNITISSSVQYIEDNASGGSYLDPGGDKKIIFSPNFSTAAAGTTNIKNISVTLTSSSGVDELEKKITLHAFSCNLGAYKLEER